MYKSQRCKVFNDFFINRRLKLKIKFLKSLFHRKNSTLYPSLNCNSFPVFPFLFKQVIKDFHCCLTVPCSKFKTVVKELFSRIQFQVLQVIVQPLIAEVVHAKPPSLKVS